MEKTRKIIQDNLGVFPEFSYYLSICDKIEENIETMPDVSIEASKALLEGISKTILKNVDSTYIESINDKLSDLIKKVLNKLIQFVDIDEGLIRAATSFVHRITEIRNANGDISHGKSVPKISSGVEHARIIANITDCNVDFILGFYFQMNWLIINDVKYEENEDFNSILDDEYLIEGILYSKALFDQDIVAYKEKLKDYNIERGIEI